MTGFTETLGIAASGMEAHASRLRLLSENIANADTPGYRRKTAAFETAGRFDTGPARPDGAVVLGPVRLARRDLSVIHDPSHPLAGPDGTYEGSNVDLVVEIADAREAQRSYEANLRVFDQARQMSSALSDLLRR